MQQEQRKTKTEVREIALRDIRGFDYWNGERKSGHWVPEAVYTGVKRTVRRHTKSATETNEDGTPKIVIAETDELIHIHGGYNPKMDGEKKTRKAFFFRGARIWRD